MAANGLAAEDRQPAPAGQDLAPGPPFRGVGPGLGMRAEWEEVREDAVHVRPVVRVIGLDDERAGWDQGAMDKNHVISKQLVQTAQRTGRGIDLEDLQGIRDRVTVRGADARNRLGGWAFAQMGAFIVSKAKLTGVLIEFIDPAYTSQTCHECGHCERSNRKSQDRFHCKACGQEAHADVNAARMIRAQALSKRASELGTRLAG